jgi:hypothetical protein
MATENTMIDPTWAQRVVENYVEVFTERESPLYKDVAERDRTARSIERDLGRGYAELFLRKANRVFRHKARGPTPTP